MTLSRHSRQMPAAGKKPAQGVFVPQASGPTPARLQCAAMCGIFSGQDINPHPERVSAREVGL